MLARLARRCHHHRRRVVFTWIVVLVGLLALGASVGGEFEDTFDLPGSESQDAIDLLEQTGFEDRAGFQAQVVVQTEAGVDDPEVRAALEDLFARLQDELPDAEVVSPYGPEGARQISPDGTIAFAEVNLPDRASTGLNEAADTIEATVDEFDAEDVQVELGGEIFVEPPESGAEMIGLVAAVIILLVAFGSLLAMGLPIGTALFGIGTGVALVQLIANVITMPSFTIQLVLMLGIGVGIDYALFIVTRYREGLRSGLDPETATVVAMDTAGRAVLFAGSTVVASVMGLFVVGLSINRALAVAAAVGVLMTMLAAVTLLPAILGFAGRNIDRFGLPHRHRADEGDRRGFWYRWSRVVQRRPAVPALLALGLLVVLAAPVLSMRLGFSDAGNRDESDTTRRAYDLLAEGFGPGFNGPLMVVARTPDADDVVVVESLATSIESVEGVEAVTPLTPNDDGDAVVFQVFPTTSPQAEETAELVHRLRDDVVPAGVEDSGATVYVGGFTAIIVDFSDFSADRLPVFIAAVLVVSFLLLMLAFRSVLVPLKAIVMNLLSIGAAYGVLVAVFQWGWGLDLLGVGETGPVEAWAPIMLFAIVFGLSMDYEVFLLSRIREEYVRTGDNGAAVADGLAATARVITAAAAIMVCVFGGFVLSEERALQLFGLGLATAVFVDASVVRLVLVPSTMELLGDWNWWLPRWLDRILPLIHIEGSTEVSLEEREDDRTKVGVPG